MAKLHQNRFLPQLTPTEGAYSAPQTPSWIKMALFLGEERGTKGTGKEGSGGTGATTSLLISYIDLLLTM